MLCLRSDCDLKALLSKYNTATTKQDSLVSDGFIGSLEFYSFATFKVISGPVLTRDNAHGGVLCGVLCGGGVVRVSDFCLKSGS